MKEKKKLTLWIVLGILGVCLLVLIGLFIMGRVIGNFPEYVSAWQSNSSTVRDGFPKQMELFHDKTALVDGAQTTYAMKDDQIRIGDIDYMISCNTDVMTLTRDSESETYTATGSSERYTYALENGGAVITHYAGNQATVIVPKTLGGAPVTGIASTFGDWHLEKIVLPDSITSIGENAFYMSSSLKEVTLPSALEEIGDRAFSSCTMLTRIDIPEGTRTIGDEAFGYCYALSSVTLPESLETIGASAFCCCSALKEISFPSGLTQIEDFAFSGCDELEALSLPDSLTLLGLSVFSDCTSLKSVHLPAHLTKLEGFTFSKCTSLTSVELPAEITKLDLRDFEGCTALSEVTIPASLVDISTDTFIDCPALAGVTIAQGNPAYVCRDNALLSLDGKTLLFYFDGAGNTTYTVPAGVETIDKESFFQCHNLKKLIVPEGVQTLAYQAILGCDALASVQLPASMTDYNDSIAECTALASVTLAAGNTEYRVIDGMLQNPDGLYLYACFYDVKDGILTLPEGIAHIFGSPYSNLKSLKKLYLPKSLVDIGVVFQNSALGDVEYLQENNITVYAWKDSDAYLAAKKNDIPVVARTN